MLISSICFSSHLPAAMKTTGQDYLTSNCAAAIKSFFFLITCLLLIKACLKFLSLTNFSNLLSFDKSVIHSSPIFCRKLCIKIIISNEKNFKLN